MIKNDKIRIYIFAFLGLCVFSSKNIIIYNEETLVLLSFILFVLFVYQYFGETLKGFFDERSKTIQTEVQNYLSLKNETLSELYKEHKKVESLSLSLNLLHDTTLNIIKKGGNTVKKGIKIGFLQEIKEKLNTLRNDKDTVSGKVQEMVGKELFSALLVKYKESKERNSIKKKYRKSIVSKLKSL